MRHTFVIILMLFFFVCGCKSNLKRNIKNEDVKTLNNVDYKEFLSEILDLKKVANVKQKQNLLFKSLDSGIPYYWIGTKWDFSGTSRIPGEGKIACGYFVTNTLTDLGFKINRISLARAASSAMIKKLTTNIKYLSSYEDLKTYLGKQLKEDAFIIGLDKHTGYITKNKDRYYFIHSSYNNNIGVMKERIDESGILQTSKTFMIGSLVQNEELLEAW